MNATDLSYTPALELGKLYRAKKLSPVEVTDTALARIERLNPKLNAYLTVTADHARELARAAEARFARGEGRGALDGIPYSIKDLEPTAGIRTTYGSKFFEHNVPAEDGAVASRLRGSGGILLGKTNTPHFGYKDMCDNLIGPPQWRDAEAAARQLGVRIQRLEIRTRDDLRRAFQAAVKARADAVVPLADPLMTVLTRDILELAARYRLPTMMENREQVEAGALLAYHADRDDAYRRAASYVDRILNGAKPGDLPVEQPTSFALVINLKTAKALGLTIPPTVLLQADAVIE